MTRIKPEIDFQPIFPPGPRKPPCPLCRHCGQRLTRLVTRTSNRNGNANRPYHKCLNCNKFISFLDDRGEHKVNRKCDCEKPSRLQVASFQKGRKLHYVCSTGQCDFYEPAEDESNRPIDLTEGFIRKLAGLKLI